MKGGEAGNQSLTLSGDWDALGGGDQILSQADGWAIALQGRCDWFAGTHPESD